MKVVLDPVHGYIELDEIVQELLVITSYSIHYTKLYEFRFASILGFHFASVL